MNITKVGAKFKKVLLMNSSKNKKRPASSTAPTPSKTPNTERKMKVYSKLALRAADRQKVKTQNNGSAFDQ